MIYLDNAATTFPKPEVVYTEMDRVNRTLAVNTGRGSYKIAREAAKIIDDTKRKLLELVNAEKIATVTFTPSITHAINQVLYGLKITEDMVIYETPYEHNAVARTVENIRIQTNCTVRQLPLQKDLRIDLKRSEFMFSNEQPDLLVINALSNVTGYVLPIKELTQLAKKYGAVVVIDGAQAVGLLPIDMKELNVDVLCFAGHKTLYGPFGIGGFILKNTLELKKVLTGGTGSNSLDLNMPVMAPGRYEASSPNIVAIAGLRAGLTAIRQKDHFHSLQMLTKYLINKISQIQQVHMVGEYEDGSTLGIISIICERYNSDDVGKILDEEFDIAVRTGYHCSPFIHEYLKDKSYGGTVRIGLGIHTTLSDIDKIIEALKSL